jgi:phosphoribosylamine---glycine ligase
VVPMVSAQDHKRAKDGDQGPNTGGMGSVSPATTLSLEGHKRIMQEIVLPAISGMAAEGRKYQGVLYAGLMMTEQGPKVLEFNARFGDPETQVVLSRMKSDILPILLGVAEGNMGETKIEWMREAAACVVIASRGYPETPETGKVIHGLETLEGESGVIAFHAATAVRDGRLVTVGGRVLGVTALGATMAAAIQRAYEAVDKVSFEGMHFRRDIGRKALARLQATA